MYVLNKRASNFSVTSVWRHIAAILAPSLLALVTELLSFIQQTELNDIEVQILSYRTVPFSSFSLFHYRNGRYIWRLTP